MLGAIAGDIIGSRFEFAPLKTNWDEFDLFTERSFFTDDTVMTIAVADAFMNSADKKGFSDKLVDLMHDYGHRWPDAGYGGRFSSWIRQRKREPYNSFGNGSAMRVSPAGWLAKSLAEAEELAAASASVTHNHPEGIKGAQAVAGAIYLGREGKSKQEIRDYVSSRYNYDLSRSLDEIRENYCFDETCQGSVPEAIIAFMESSNFEDAVRKAVWLRGDADTQAAIAGSIAEAFYGGMPEHIATKSLQLLDTSLYQKYLQWDSWLKERAE